MTLCYNAGVVYKQNSAKIKGWTMRIELYYDYGDAPECSYEADVVPRVGDLITVVGADRCLLPYRVVRVMHWITTAPDETLSLESVQLLVEGDFYLCRISRSVTRQEYLRLMKEA